MQTDATRMPARYFALLCELLKQRGVDVETMLEKAGIWPTRIYGPDATLTVRQLEALVAAARAATGRNDLGFELGRQIKLSSHEILGYGIITSPTLDHALQLAARYYRLITPTFRMQYQRGPAHSELIFKPALSLSPDALQFMMETIVVSAHEQLKSLAPQLPPYEIFVSYGEPADAKPYRELRPARFHFEAEQLAGARMVLESTATAQKLPMADRTALAMAEARCEELLRRTAQSAGLGEWIAMMLREAHEGMPTLAELARLLNQSPRTLDRHLAQEGHRFLEIAKRIRHEKACALLRASLSLSITQVAYQLGYKDAANFTRAFRREAGISPSEYRQSAK